MYMCMDVYVVPKELSKLFLSLSVLRLVEQAIVLIVV